MTNQWGATEAELAEYEAKVKQSAIDRGLDLAHLVSAWD